MHKYFCTGPLRILAAFYKRWRHKGEWNGRSISQALSKDTSPSAVFILVNPSAKHHIATVCAKPYHIFHWNIAFAETLNHEVSDSLRISIKSTNTLFTLNVSLKKEQQILNTYYWQLWLVNNSKKFISLTIIIVNSLFDSLIALRPAKFYLKSFVVNIVEHIVNNF